MPFDPKSRSAINTPTSSSSSSRQSPVDLTQPAQPETSAGSRTIDLTTDDDFFRTFDGFGGAHGAKYFEDLLGTGPSAAETSSKRTRFTGEEPVHTLVAARGAALSFVPKMVMTP